MDEVMLKKFFIPIFVFAPIYVYADETDFMKPHNNVAYDNFMSQSAKYEVDLFNDQSESLIDTFFMGPLTPDEIREKYEQNEIAANKELGKKPIRIKGTIESINEDAFGNGNIVAVNKVTPMSSLRGVTLKIDKTEPIYLKLKKGDKLDIICTMDKYIIKKPILKDCYLTSTFKDEEEYKKLQGALLRSSYLKAEKISVENLSKLFSTKAILSFITYTSFYKSNEDLLEKSCVANDDRCYMSMVKILKNGKVNFSEENKNKLEILGNRIKESLNFKAP